MVSFSATYGKLFAMPKFRTKDLLVASALTAIGLGLIGGNILYQEASKVEQPTPFTLFCWLVGPPLIGAGLLTPFKHPWIGAALVIALMIAVALLAN
jgi:hypothetical protein